MTGSKKDQNEQFAELFGVLIEEFGPALIKTSERFLKDRSQQQSDTTTETGTDNSQNSQTPTGRSYTEADHPDDDATNSRKHTMKSKSKGADYTNAYAFEQQKTGRVRRVAMTLATNGDVLGAMKDLIVEAGEVRKFEEAQRTQRTDIAARRDVAIANIEAQRAAIQTYLDKSFDERRENFNKLFAVIDHALATNNMQELAMSLQGVLTLAQSSPFKDLQTVEATATALADPDHEWDF
jgi:hypothetical protein